MAVRRIHWHQDYIELAALRFMDEGVVSPVELGKKRIVSYSQRYRLRKASTVPAVIPAGAQYR